MHQNTDISAPTIHKVMLKQLRFATSKITMTQAYLGTGIILKQKRDPTMNCDPWSRIIMPLQGETECIYSRQGKRCQTLIRPGQCFYFSPMTSSMEIWKHRCRYLGVVYRENTMRLIYVDHPGGKNRRRPVPATYYHTTVPLSEPGTHIKQAIDVMCKEQVDSLDATSLISILLNQSLIHLQNDTLSTETVNNTAHRRWRTVMEYLINHYSEPITRDSVAGALKMHPNYLSILAQNQTGLPFQKHLENIRLERACQILTATSLKLEAIAQLCGYSNCDYFIKVFKRVKGITPGHYRT